MCISASGDGTEEELLSETEFDPFLARNGASVSNVIPPVNGRSAERIEADGRAAYVSLFACEKGMRISGNGCRCREGAPPEEYFFNTGKAPGAIHRRTDYSDQSIMAHTGSPIPDEYVDRYGPQGIQNGNGRAGRDARKTAPCS